MKEEINIEELVKTVTNTAKQMNFKEFLHATSAQIADLLEELLQYRKHFGMFKDKVEVSGLEDEKKKLDDILQQMRGDG